MLYVESPFGVGFSYSTNQSDFLSMEDDAITANNFRFLTNWLDRFPQYKSRDLYLAGQNAGNFVSRLAELIVFHNKKTGSGINLKGIIVSIRTISNDMHDRLTIRMWRFITLVFFLMTKLGNPSIDAFEDARGRFMYHAGHGIIPDQTIRMVDRMCSCPHCWHTTKCERALELSRPKTFTYNVKDVYDLPCQDPQYSAGLPFNSVSYTAVLSVDLSQIMGSPTGGGPRIWGAINKIKKVFLGHLYINKIYLF